MTYLELTTKVPATATVDDTVQLDHAARQKSRQRVRLASGRDAGILLAAGSVLADGDVLAAPDGTRVGVRAAPEAVITARTADPLRLARACYHLGNRHVELAIGPGWVRFKPDHVLATMVQALGLSLCHEQQVFAPERGAYAHGGHTHAPRHDAGQAALHAHEAPHDAVEAHG